MASLLSTVYDYVLLLLSLLLLVLEGVATAVTLLLPAGAIAGISRFLKRVLPQSQEERELAENVSLQKRVETMSAASSFVEICALHGYQATEHIVPTKDGYMLGVHRIRPKRKSRGTIYLHHGLLMNSEIWVATPHASDSVAFQLVDAGYDIWLGNNRGNKYSKKHEYRSSNSREFWNFSLDEFAIYDIPALVDYVLEYTEQESLTYIGFSQGSAQAFAALAVHPKLNKKINLFIALGPAMAPPSVGPRILHSLMTASPSLLYILFGHRVILRSTVFWQNIMLPQIFVRVIDLSNRLLFKWRSRHISWAQKLTGYSHLYSYTSVKCVVHWFQIIAQHNGILMYDDDTFSFFGSRFGVPVSRFYQVPPYPTQNITTPIEIIYGTKDTLVDIGMLLEKLPKPAGVFAVPDYEHLEMIWGDKVSDVIVPRILKVLQRHSPSLIPHSTLRTPPTQSVSITYAESEKLWDAPEVPAPPFLPISPESERRVLR